MFFGVIFLFVWFGLVLELFGFLFVVVVVVVWFFGGVNFL